ncbi:MAG: glycoside hydrolase family 127 protein [Bacteroidales bacterium]|nr:glycoside hydrolase family 127 protein [Bacteroidales bacterium]MBR0037168.1 glycoside hydrolase family 127 protein [Bacteroidales bacterium]
MKRQEKRITVALLALTMAASANAQSKLYPQLFDLQDVVINDGPFRHAQDLNDQVLLQYDLGRLMQPYENQAGLPESGKAFENWGGTYGLQGHVGGHYISALAISYASCQDVTVKAQLKERMDQFVTRLKECQDAWDAKGIDMMKGYCGAVYNSEKVFTTLAAGNMDEYWKSWVPFYNIHKTMAGLRDAWVYAGNEEAKEVFLKFCDWGVNLVSGLTDDQLQGLLNQEHGGINEMFADAYQMTGEEKYLTASKRYAHKWLLTGMAANTTTTINNVHANTQVPKVVGFERTYQQDGSNTYKKAALNFWKNVVNKRTIAVGGNSIAEWFPNDQQYGNFITSVEGVETCNTNNMMKLTEDLFADSHNSMYGDFYEQAMYNHILSSQHPETGGYVYFTSARPQHYRVYSQVNQAMWCCVGTGMENHGKYGEFVYAHDGENLYVNLFVPTTLTWSEKGVKLTQETSFPYEAATKITILKGGTFTLNVRHPNWCSGFEVKVNGTAVNATETLGYLPVSRIWQAGDVVEVSLPMQVTLQPLQNYTDYVAFKYGPILLGAKTGTDGLTGIFADDSRMGHVASGQQKNIYTAPLLIGNREDLVTAVQPVDLSKLHFKINGYYNDEKWSDLVLEPFANIHEARYMMYWLNVDGEKWNSIKAELEAEEAAAQLLESRTLDYVDAGTQQSEADHYMQVQNSNKGEYQGEYWRDGSGYVSYKMQTKGKSEKVTLMVRYWGGDAGNRKFDIQIDNQTIATETLTGGKNEFVNKEYEIPASLLEGKTEVRVKFKAKSGNIFGGIYYVRLLISADEVNDLRTVNFNLPRADEQLFTLDGRSVNTTDNGLPRGIYISRNKKIIVK